MLAEIGEEKIDIILWNEKNEQYITNALSPAKVEEVTLHKKSAKRGSSASGEKTATVAVAEDQLSLAIGKGGQNVRLASKLTGWSIDIEKHVEKPVKETEAKKIAEKEQKTEPKKAKLKKPKKSKTNK